MFMCFLRCERGFQGKDLYLVYKKRISFGTIIYPTVNMYIVNKRHNA